MDPQTSLNNPRVRCAQYFLDLCGDCPEGISPSLALLLSTYKMSCVPSKLFDMLHFLADFKTVLLCTFTFSFCVHDNLALTIGIILSSFYGTFAVSYYKGFIQYWSVETNYLSGSYNLLILRK